MSCMVYNVFIESEHRKENEMIEQVKITEEWTEKQGAFFAVRVFSPVVNDFIVQGETFAWDDAVELARNWDPDFNK